MANPWDAPPTEDEMAKARTAPPAGWDAPPTADEIKAAAPQKNEEGPSLGQSAGDALRGVEQGFTFGFADELGGLQQATADVVSRGLPRFVNDALGIETRYQKPLLESGGDLLDIYRQGRNENRAEYAKAKERSPYLYGGGSFLGGMVAPGGAGKSIGKALKAGGGYGALEGMGSSEADLTKLDAGNLARFGIDPALGGVGGVGGGAAGYGIQKYVAPAVKRGGEYLYKKGIEKAGKFLTGGVTSIDPKKAISPEATEEALKAGTIPYGAEIEGTLSRIGNKVKTGDAAREGVLDSSEFMGNEGPLFRKLIAEADKRGKQVASTSLNPAKEKVWFDLRDRLIQLAKRDPATGTINSIKTARAGLKRNEGFKSDLYDMIDWDNVTERPVNRQRKAAAAMLKEATEASLDAAGKKAGPGSFEADLAQEFRPVKQRLGNLLEAEEFALDAAEKARRKPEKAPIRAGELLAWAQGIPAVGPVVRGAQHLLETRGPATAARFNYDLGRALQTLAENPAALGRAATRSINSSGRTAVPAVPDEFWERFVPPPPPPAETEEERRIRLLRETLYPHGRPK
jgi:hypothetical protein